MLAHIRQDSEIPLLPGDQGTVDRRRGPSGFTFIEILVALCIVLIALVPLIRLHVVSIFQVDAATHLARATFLANAKLAEVVASNVVESGRSQGRVSDADLHVVFQWVLIVDEAHPSELENIDLADLRRVHVDVAWQDGRRDRTVSLDTLVRPGRYYKERLLDPESDGQPRSKTTEPRSGI